MLGQLLIGHVVGDYFFQTSWMANNKTKPGLLGWFAASMHSLVYAASVVTVTQILSLEWMIAVFLSHVFIDKYSIGKWYLSQVKGMRVPKKYDSVDYTSLYWIIYVVIDNSMHLFLMYLAYAYLYLL